MRLPLAKQRLVSARLVAALPLLASVVAGCSVLDGWGGLEGDPKENKPEGGNGTDGGSGSSSGDAGVLCGAVRCDVSKGEGCCLDPTGTASYCAASCNGPALMCDNSAQCVDLLDAAAAACCFSYGGGGSGGFAGGGSGGFPGAGSGATCTTGTCTGAELCSPATGCPGGRRCVQQRGYYICM